MGEDVGEGKGGGENASTGELLQLSFLEWFLPPCCGEVNPWGDFWSPLGLLALLSSLGAGDDTGLS